MVKDVVLVLCLTGTILLAPLASAGKGGSNKEQSVERDAQGAIACSQKARGEFKRANPCPSTGRSSGACPGYVIDHVTALKPGGADQPSNMQWQTVADAKAKDRYE